MPLPRKSSPVTHMPGVMVDGPQAEVPGNHPSAILIAQVRILDRKGYSVEDIMLALNISYPVACTALMEASKVYEEAKAITKSVLCARKRQEYADLRKECWIAWERSKTIYTSETEVMKPVIPVSERVEEACKAAAKREARGAAQRRAQARRGGTSEQSSSQAELRIHQRTTVREDRVGDPRYLAIIAECLKAERELDGLDQPKQLNANVQVLDWDRLISEVPEKTSQEVLEGRIVQVLDSPTPGISADVSPLSSDEE